MILTADRLSVGTVTLKIGAGTEVVKVTSEAPPVATTSSEQSAVISADEIAALPVLGNDYVSLTTIVPAPHTWATGTIQLAASLHWRTSWRLLLRVPHISARTEFFRV